MPAASQVTFVFRRRSVRRSRRCRSLTRLQRSASMSDTPRHEVTLRKLVYTMPGVDAVTVRRDVPYRTAESGALGMDVYYPAGPERTRPTVLPAVVVATGFSDAGGRKMLGCVMKEMESYIGWARLVAGSGNGGGLYRNSEPRAGFCRRL